MSITKESIGAAWQNIAPAGLAFVDNIGSSDIWFKVTADQNPPSARPDGHQVEEGKQRPFFIPSGGALWACAAAGNSMVELTHDTLASILTGDLVGNVTGNLTGGVTGTLPASAPTLATSQMGWHLDGSGNLVFSTVDGSDVARTHTVAADA